MTTLQPAYRTPLPIKILVNIGALMDIPTGRWLLGRYGESLLLGGLGALTGVVGHGNNFKSTFLNYMAAMILHRIKKSMGSTYDCEINVHEARLLDLYMQSHDWKGDDPFTEGRWLITDSTQHLGGEWFDITKAYLRSKDKVTKDLRITLPFINRTRTGYIEIPFLSFTIIDSLSEFKTEDVTKMQDDATLGDKEANTAYMRQGLQKNRLLLELPNLCGSHYHYALMSAHIGDKIEMDPRNPSMQKLQHLRGNVKLKGVPEKFTFLMNNCWHAYGASVLMNDSTKAPEYPRNPEENQEKGSKDLNVVRLRQLRSKSGATGIELEIVVSQSEGVKPELTEYHYLKSRARFGLVGSNISHAVALMPENTFGRTTVRGKLDEDPLLRQALGLTADLAQMIQYHAGEYGDILCTAEELYEDIKKLGYDWNVLLDTRRWWCPDNDKEGQNYLSIMDLLRMRQQLYVPYWLKDSEVPEAVKHIPRTKVF